MNEIFCHQFQIRGKKHYHRKNNKIELLLCHPTVMIEDDLFQVLTKLHESNN
jgi:hypothetical protein